MMERARPASLRTLRRVLAGLTVPALAVAAPMLYIAWQHNPQGEFHEAGRVHWAAWLAVGWSWFLGLWVALAGLAVVVWGAGAWSARRRARSDAPAG